MDLHDEIGSNLGSIGLLASEATRRSSDPDRLPQLLGQIANLAQLTNIGLRLMGRGLKDNPSSVADLFREVKAQIAKLAFEDQVIVRFAFDAVDADGIISSSVHRHAVMILVEATHNALKHAGATMLNISVTQLRTHEGQMTIADDGCGFDCQDARGRGSGLENMVRRAKEAGGEVFIQSAPSMGTRVTFSFPCAPKSANRLGYFVASRLRKQQSALFALFPMGEDKTKRH